MKIFLAQSQVFSLLHVHTGFIAPSKAKQTTIPYFDIHCFATAGFMAQGRSLGNIEITMTCLRFE